MSDPELVRQKRQNDELKARLEAQKSRLNSEILGHDIAASAATAAAEAARRRIKSCGPNLYCRNIAMSAAAVATGTATYNLIQSGRKRYQVIDIESQIAGIPSISLDPITRKGSITNKETAKNRRSSTSSQKQFIGMEQCGALGITGASWPQ